MQRYGVLLSVVHFVRISAGVDDFVLSEEKRYAPYSCKRHYYIQYSAYNTCTSAECPGYYVKLEQPYKTPVESAHKQYEKSYLVKHNYRYRPSVKRECVDFISNTHSFSIVTAKNSIILVENAQKKCKIRINNQKYHKTIKI